MTHSSMIINGLYFEQTCGACPEIYHAYLGNTQIGYLRLSHGFFNAEYPSSNGTIVYAARPDGDGALLDHERYFYLSSAGDALLKHHKFCMSKESLFMATEQIRSLTNEEGPDALAEAIKLAKVEERERCANVAERHFDNIDINVPRIIAADIRKGDKDE